MQYDLVVVGLGYVGLPLVSEACNAGLRVAGLDASPRVVDGLNSGQSHVDDIADAEIRSILATGFFATTDPGCVADADSVVICVPTPLSTEGGPDLSLITSACRDLAPHLNPGTLVVLESTTYPGTTAEVVAPLLFELSGLSAADLHVAYSPERIDPGNSQFGLRNTPKIVGGDSPAASAKVEALYSRVVEDVIVATGTREAESAKLLENTYRHVNIALVNEMAKFFHELNIDFWEVIRLASTKPFGFHAFQPGPGVGGHCIPIDPNYLSHRVRTQLGYAFRFVELAQEINASMPSYVVARIAELLNNGSRAVRGSSILLLGVTYKRDISDQRESPAIEIARRLIESGAQVRYCDPHVARWTIDGADVQQADISPGVSEADITVLLQDHSDFDLTAVQSAANQILDTRGRLAGPNVELL